MKIALSICVLCWVYLSYGTTWIETQWIYPNPYRSIVKLQSDVNGVPASLVTAVMLAESKNNERAVSSPGAIGLMQVMPETANWIQEQRHLPSVSEEQLQDPKQNIAIGTWYLGYLLKEFHGNTILALAAYNAGRGHVEEWVEKYRWDARFDDIDQIPFPETRVYVKKVLSYQERYKSLYPDF